MESRFGTSFGAVRMHADPAASAAARSISARAFTLGNHVYFRDGAYAPGTERGRRLLAHELAHVLQGSDQIVHRYDETTEPAGQAGNSARNVGEAAGGLLAIIGRRVRAASCLGDLFAPMRDLTFTRWIPHVCERTAGYLHSREWDAFGHCWIGCEGSRRCGEAPTSDLGLLRELQRELWARYGGEPHDSFWQDVGNQARGRMLAFSTGTCFNLCDGAHLARTLDLSAPKRNCVDCADPTGAEFRCP
jgi:hypothetical protein